MNPNYYEAILQLRNPDREIEQFVVREIRENTKNAYSSKVKKVRNGLDVYLSSNKFAAGLGKKLLDRFGGELKTSEKLHSRDRQTSRELYRVNVLYRPFHVKNGDLVNWKGEAMRIAISGRKIIGTSIETGRKYELKEEKDVKSIETLKPETTTVAKAYPKAEVISSETYQNVELIGARGAVLKPGQKVKVVFGNGKAYLVKL